MKNLYPVPALSPTELLGSLSALPRAGDSASPPEGFPDPEPDAGWRFFARARDALAQGLKSVLDPSDGVVLLPAYICDVVVPPLRQAGFRIRLYDTASDLRVDWDALERATAGASVGALVLVHYFGFPREPDRARSWCDGKGVLLMEDVAHTFGTEADGRPLGAFGDLSVFSLRKVAPVPDGAWLRTAPGLSPPPVPARRNPGVPLRLARLTGRYLLNRFPGPFPHLRSGPGPTFGKEEPAEREGRAPARGARVSRAILRAYPWAGTRPSRRRVYGAWLEWIGRGELEPLFAGLPEGVSPACAPALAPDRAGRDRALHRLRAAGVGAHTWPRLPGESAGTSAERIQRRLLSLPIDGRDPDETVERIVALESI